MKERTSLVSIVSPAFNEEQVVSESYRRLTKVMQSANIEYELIFVNDGSVDHTGKILAEICEMDSHVRLLDLSRNFGQMASITAGIQYSRGDAVIIIDIDLQDPPEVILQMIDKWREGYDVVYGKRIKRKDETLFKKAVSKLFFMVLKGMTDVDVPLGSGEFQLLDRRVCDCLLKLPERNRYIRGLISWVGFNQTGVEFVREGRYAGKTKYPLKKLTNLAINGFTCMTYKPMRISAYVGLVSFFLCFAGILIYMVSSLVHQRGISLVELLLLVNLLFTSVIFIMLGVKGEYLGKVYEEIKGRPLYVVKEISGFEANDEPIKKHAMK
ncbi:MAG: glycosyltransferase family 2 protein [Firmicutes bacterium]|nr:glycosyltransferase family 2 protein [Bacillota bacterium]